MKKKASALTMGDPELKRRISASLNVLFAERPQLRTIEVANAVGVSDSSVMNWRAGKTMPSESNRARLAEFFGVTRDSFDEGNPIYLDGREAPPPMYIRPHTHGRGGPKKATPVQLSLDPDDGTCEIKLAVSGLTLETALQILALCKVTTDDGD